MRVVTTTKPKGTALGAGMVVAGKYRLDSQVGKGGMGEVWVATNLVLDSKIALKVLLRSLLDNAEAGERLLREARAAARISHRNIVQVYDFGYVETGEPFIVMELLRGESLAERLERVVRLPAVQAVETLVPVAHALATAHAKGIIHRDLKPGNVFLAIDESNSETPKVVDFGIAKMVDVKHQARMTLDGSVLGSPEYLSPEQAVGESDIDARADVWALSVTLYESITGRLPFDDPNYNKLLHMIIGDNPVPTTELGAGDKDLWQILRRGLEKKREERWQSVYEMGSAMEEWLHSHGVYSTGSTFGRVTETGIIGTGRLVDTGKGARAQSGSGARAAALTQLTAGDIVESPAQAPAAKSRALWIALVAAAFVGVGAVAGLMLLRGAGSPAPAAQPAPSARVLEPAAAESAPAASASAPVPVAAEAASAAPLASAPAKKPKVYGPLKPGGAGKVPGTGTAKGDDVYGSRR